MKLPRLALGIVASLALVGASAGDADAHSQRGRRHGHSKQVKLDKGEAKRNYDSYGARRTHLGRFAGLDRNHDGVVTRREWRGNGLSFRQHDRNRDGFITSHDFHH